MKRGDIYQINLAPRSGSEQSGSRPAVVISHDIFNETAGWSSIIVIPLSTSPKQARRGPTAVSLRSSDTGLPRDSIALCHQITTLDRAKFVKKLGQVPTAILKQVEQGVLVALDIQQ